MVHGDTLATQSAIEIQLFCLVPPVVILLAQFF